MNYFGETARSYVKTYLKLLEGESLDIQCTVATILLSIILKKKFGDDYEEGVVKAAALLAIAPPGLPDYVKDQEVGHG